MVKGYKVFNKDWTCRNKQYSCPGVFEEDGELEVCEHGMHFCKVAVDCFRYYGFDTENRVAEVIAHGTVLEEENKCCTDKLEIVREIPWDEVLQIVNAGKQCTGLRNSGDRNSGYYNSGDCNSSSFNSGDYNSGNRNSGDYNSGSCNSGYYNSGYYNSGDRNSGDRNSGSCNSGSCNSGSCNSGSCNSGDWNDTCFSNGCFNTVEPKIYLFDKPSDWTFRDWQSSEACCLMARIDMGASKWIREKDMTDEEKAAHPEHQTTGGYLKKPDTSECAQIWWNGLSDRQRNIIKAIPNFDPEIFCKITGIRIED